ncbi:MAG TPA: trypsin-like serine protease [Roseibacterium sp.]|nr:trypsin-like serine protease [Roseibacterium sp.]
MLHLPPRTALAALILAAAPLAPASAQDTSLPPTFGEVALISNFQPDPHQTSLQAGGAIRAEYTDAVTGNRCVGHFANAPDLRLQFTAADFGYPLSFYVEAREDTVLLVATPDGKFHCNDDSAALNPALTFDTPLGGEYNIWVGTYAVTGSTFPPAELGITELEPPAENFDRAFFGNDDRVIIDAATAPWNMIGFLDLSEASCTATLIGPATILTSAHCLATDGVIDTPPVEFLAGFQNGAFVARPGVSGYHVAAGYLAGEQEGTDYAFVFLNDPIGDQLGWMDVGLLSPQDVTELQAGRGPDILQAGYSYDQQGVLTGNLNCPFVELGAENTIIHECDTLRGDSGSPLFIADGDRFRIIGVESRTDAQPDQPFDRNIAVYTEYVLKDLAALPPR